MPSLRPARRASFLGAALTTTAALLLAPAGPAAASPTEPPAALSSPAGVRGGPPAASPPTGPAVAGSEAGLTPTGTEHRSVVDIPANVTAGVAVFDRLTGRFTESLQADRAFRSASVVKLLLALDFLWNRGPGYEVPQADRDRLEAMLSRSDDAAAGHYWSVGGGSAVISRMVPRLGLTGTAPPPAGYPGYWGYTATTAADTVRVYRYLLDTAPAPVRDLVMGALHRSDRCAADGFDQGFGLPSAFDGPGAVKQGWSGFSSGGCLSSGTPAAAPSRAGGAGPRTSVPADGAEGAVTGGSSPGAAPPSRGASAAAVDLTSDALHTTGTVGPDDRTVVAVLTLHPDGTPYGTAYSKVTALTGSLDVPGAVRPSGTRFTTWGSGVRVRTAPTTSSTALTTLPAGVDVLVACQKQGGQVSVPPYVNDWWAYLPQYGGWITNIYVTSPDNTLPGVPRCS
ncbi:hypothetical protein [Streptomyces sp. NBC_01185]|uniref:hypothetical protein n=1 Tax=Streptomyces sp. NBC_01185 TaxID=2903764 RepID=UPI00386FBB88|nr:hypothetical protein OG770_36070 [Streptomyces sp. NBC_01185]